MESAQPLSPLATRMLARARRELDAGRSDEAQRTLESVLALAPDHRDAIHCMGMAAHANGDQATAVACFRREVAGCPEDSDARVWLGIALFQDGRVEDAIAELQRAVELAPESVSAWYNLAEVFRTRGRTIEAMAAARRVLQIDAAHTPAALSLAHARASIGEVASAIADLRKILEREPDRAEAWFALSNLKLERFDEQDLLFLERAFARADLDVRARIWFGFTLARALEDAGDYSRAFEVLQTANSLQRSLVKWDGRGERNRVEAIVNAFDRELPAAQEPGLGGEVIFIVSIPRSGSTMVEQILASHSTVEGANEIGDLSQIVDDETRRLGGAYPLWVPSASAADWHRLGTEYLARTAVWRERRPRFTDKSLGTWMLVGAALAMLPAARVVICRRDPLETCLGCYRQWFAQAAGFAYDLDELADYCIDFQRMTDYWLRKYPDRTFDLEYEVLVAEPEPTIRRLLDFCGLPFEPACLEFHKTQRTVLSAPSAAQVRQPIRRDTARAARYGDKLDGLRRRLRQAGLPVGEQC